MTVSQISKLAAMNYYQQSGYPPEMVGQPVAIAPEKELKGMSLLDTLLTVGALGSGAASGGMYAASRLGPSMLEQAAKATIPLEAKPYQEFAKNVIEKSIKDVDGRFRRKLLRYVQPAVEKVVGTAVEEAVPAITPAIERAVLGTQKALRQSAARFGAGAGIFGAGLGAKVLYDKFLSDRFKGEK